MSKDPQDKLVKLLTRSGHAINLYASPSTIEAIQEDPSFLRFSDNGNDNIRICIHDITAFEVLDDRTDIEQLQPLYREPSPSPEIPCE